MKILFLSRWFPYPATNGSKLRIYNLICGLSKHHDLTLLSFAEPAEKKDLSVFQDIVSEVYTVPWREYDPQSGRSRLGFLGSKPRFLIDTHSAQMESEISRQLATKKYDLVIASQLTMASYYEVFRNTPAVFEEVELGSYYEPAHLTPDRFLRFRHLLTWLKLKTYLARMLKAFAACTVVSSEEKLIFSRSFTEHQQKAVVIPNCIDLRQYKMSNIERRHHHLIFSGSFRYTANYQAMIWFLEKVYPLILEHVPDIQLLITGDHADLPIPKKPNVYLTGHVEDIKALIASCDVSVVPIWSGGGTRLKILEAMAVGTPVVSTSKGAEGLVAVAGEHILIADEPEHFAAQVIQILLDRQFASRLASNAYQLIKEHYDWAQVMPKFLKTIEGVTIGSS